MLLLRTLLVVAIATLAGCPGGDRGIGESCNSHGDCDSSLQCTNRLCVPRCARAPDCGDGHACDSDGICQLATGQPGDRCTSEVDCAPGLSCQIDGDAVDENGRLRASCALQNPARPPGATCAVDDDCRNGTCALGHCVDLCAVSRDCATGNTCMDIPRVEANGAVFAGCLPAKGNVTWSIPVAGPLDSVLVPVPSRARSAQLVFSIDDEAQRVGAQSLTSPSGRLLYRPCNAVENPDCDPIDNFYTHYVRHQPLFGQSVITLPSWVDRNLPFETGVYRVQVSSYRANGTPGSAIPRLTASVRIDAAVLLDLHFHFLNFKDHMCESAFGDSLLDASAAKTASFFQNEYLGTLRSIFASGGVALGSLTYEDLLDQPDLDGLDVARAGRLFELGSYPVGINVFFVRTLSPVGLQAFGPNPGPAGLPHTPQSGIVIGLDTLCYRSWTELARLTAHELARYMGLHHNVELGADPIHNNWRDKIEDSDDSDRNLMFFSEFGGVEISPGQRDILTRSGVLR
jgi:hypothetical protein